MAVTGFASSADVGEGDATSSRSTLNTPATARIRQKALLTGLHRPPRCRGPDRFRRFYALAAASAGPLVPLCPRKRDSMAVASGPRVLPVSSRSRAAPACRARVDGGGADGDQYCDD